MAALDDYEDNPLFTPLEQLVLRYVDETSVTRKTSDEVEEELGKHFSYSERVELALIVGLWNMTNRVFNTLRVDPEQFVDPGHTELMYSTFGKQEK